MSYLNLLGTIASIVMAIVAIIKANNAKRQADSVEEQAKVSKEQLKEMKRQFELKNNVKFSVDWGPNKLHSNAKRNIKDKRLIGDSNVYKNRPGVFNSIDDRIMGLEIKNESELNALNLRVSWWVYIPSIYDFTDEIQRTVFEVEYGKPGVTFRKHRRYNKLLPLEDVIARLFYIGLIPVVIFEIDRIYYEIKGESIQRIATSEDIEGKTKYMVKHKDFPENITEEELFKWSPGDWKGFGEEIEENTE